MGIVTKSMQYIHLHYQRHLRKQAYVSVIESFIHFPHVSVKELFK